mmetsp:Transcript_1465/g.4998  ORF Transcript_1465/g.4998 Transcript_1465/m.4998 type:complete len:288 (+) Transcript_1465:211-1074(+)
MREITGEPMSLEMPTQETHLPKEMHRWPMTHSKMWSRIRRCPTMSKWRPLLPLNPMRGTRSTSLNCVLLSLIFWIMFTRTILSSWPTPLYKIPLTNWQRCQHLPILSLCWRQNRHHSTRKSNLYHERRLWMPIVCKTNWPLHMPRPLADIPENWLPNLSMRIRRLLCEMRLVQRLLSRDADCEGFVECHSNTRLHFEQKYVFWVDGHSQIFKTIISTSSQTTVGLLPKSYSASFFWALDAIEAEVGVSLLLTVNTMVLFVLTTLACTRTIMSKLMRWPEAINSWSIV